MIKDDEPNEEFEPEHAKEPRQLEPPMRFFTDRELQEMWREDQDPEDEKREPETYAEAVLRCLGTYPNPI